VRAALPVNEKAAQLYAEGIDSLRRYEAATARVRLEKAVAEDPLHALAHSALARAYQALGYDEKARASARKAQDLSLDLLRGDQLVIEARYRELIGERDRAIEVGEAQPDDPRPVGLSRSTRTAGRRRVPHDRRAPPHWPELSTAVDLAEADVARALDYARQADAATRAATATAQAPAWWPACFLEGTLTPPERRLPRGARGCARCIWADRGSAVRTPRARGTSWTTAAASRDACSATPSTSS
jgi:tetratricopeptide (TPR) repeat protein